MLCSRYGFDDTSENINDNFAHDYLNFRGVTNY